MSENSKIQWTGSTWNPIRVRVKQPIERPDPGDNSLKILTKPWGYHCEHISPGCKNCYAERMNSRMLPAWGTGLKYNIPNRDKVEIYLDKEELMQPLRWKKPRKVFPCSMTDMFADFVPDEFIDQMFAIMALTPHHTYQVLTKRAKRMSHHIDGFQFGRVCDIGQSIDTGKEKPNANYPIRNIWLGVSVENQQTADERIPLLLQTVANKRFVSYEPALEPIDFTRIEHTPESSSGGCCFINSLKGTFLTIGGGGRIGSIDWVIVGGESGPGARPFDVNWARDVIRQCRDAGVPVFVKQMGAVPIIPACRQHHYDWGEGRGKGSGPASFDYHEDERSGMWRINLRDRKGGDWSEWADHLRVREFPEVHAHA